MEMQKQAEKFGAKISFALSQLSGPVKRIQTGKAVLYKQGRSFHKLGASPIGAAGSERDLRGRAYHIALPATARFSGGKEVHYYCGGGDTAAADGVYRNYAAK